MRVCGLCVPLCFIVVPLSLAPSDNFHVEQRVYEVDVDFNAVVLTATGREKTTAALVSPSLIAIHVNAKTVSLYAPVFPHRFLPIIGGSISGWRFPGSMSYAQPFSFFFYVFRSRISRYCEGVSPQPPPAAAAVLSETDRRCYKAGSLHGVLRCRSSTAVLQH